ncbi:hypothetical protein QAD02_019591 [Eretmocerus hayati]|uniref:Uncharacterized protein n=1 Tax=Eretmocerus hayati TaxID=131215 RepID=A0ACC2PJN1_9HYME|nr:hypothetical protein QAD02_019591 [Eretmocerus hayati]
MIDHTVEGKMELMQVYKNLDTKVELIRESLNGRKPNMICDTSTKMFDQGVKAKQRRKFDDAYIYFKRWLLCNQWIQSKGLDKDMIKKYFPQSKVNQVKSLLTEVTDCIRIEFDARRNPPRNSNSPKAIGIKKNSDLSLQLPDVPSDEPQPKREDDITCSELHNLMQKGDKKVLIIDVRPSKEFSKSSLPYKDNMIHIPAEKIKHKQVPSVYKNLLTNDEKAYKRFEKRSAQYTDVIVLVDSNSSVETMENDSSINFIKESFEKWDACTRYKKIAVLKNGFEEWKKKYPEKVFIPSESLPKHVSCPSDLSQDPPINSPSLPENNEPVNNDLDYTNQASENTLSPILSTSQRLDPPVRYPSTSQTPKLIKKDDNPTKQHNNTPKSHQSQFLPEIMNGNHHPSNTNINNKQALITNKIKPSKVVLEPMRPIIDRSKKPSHLSKNNLQEKISALEKEVENIDDVMFFWNRTLSKGGQLDDWTREQYEMKSKSREQKILEINRLKNSKTGETKSANLYPALPDKSLSKMTLKSKPKINSTKPLSNEEKENLDVRKDKKEKPLATNVEPEGMEIDEDKETYIEPLKSENSFSNSGLKRSHSSPNLSQKLEPRSIPEINRNLKPKAIENSDRNRMQPIIPHQGREMRMEPVSCSNGHPGITGLKNLGNSCYMNSIVQCLSNTVYLANYFIEGQYMNDLNKNHEKNNSGNYVAEEVAQVIRALWRGLYKSISPHDLKVVVGQYKLQFGSCEQQDSHEFLMFLLDWMHNDLKQKRKISFNRELTAAEKEWEKSMDGQSSIISNLFFGQLRSTIECMTCRENSITYETFNSFTVSLPASNKCTLDECIRKFVSGQRVSGWKCPSCKEPREVIKKFDIAKLPHIIVIHLNRFGASGIWLEKKNTSVDFPLVNLDFGPYLVQDNDTINNTKNSSTCYNLYAMSNHYGTMLGGHYTAYCKSHAQNKWYRYDDHTVNDVPLSQVENQKTTAYLLFYSLASAESFLKS